MDCGPACLRMIARYYGKQYSLQTLRNYTRISKEGVNMLGLMDAASQIGFEAEGTSITLPELQREAPLPCIVHWHQDHFVVITKITKKKIWIADPRDGIVAYYWPEFLEQWTGSQDPASEGLALVIQPGRNFQEYPDEKNVPEGFRALWQYARPYYSLMGQVILGLAAGTALQLVFPFLTKSVVDAGIATKDISLILIILAGQLFLLAGRTGLDFIRRWILLHISTRVNIAVLSDFLLKLMKLPIPFFDGRMTGDIMQRIYDQHRIEQFLTSSVLNILFALLNLLAFTAVLFWYNPLIGGIFLVGSALYIGWIRIFLQRRRALDFLQFEIHATNQSKLIQLIHGIQEIKLNSCEDQKRNEWESIQGRLFHANIKSLSLTQKQEAGAIFINEGKDLFITAYAATLVISGQLSLGMMLAIQYIIGQLHGPVDQLVHFTQTMQDARISLERLQEIHAIGNEETSSIQTVKELPTRKDIQLTNVSFTYPGAGNTPALEDLSLSIPGGKVTAIVGSSGSGKTTLLKLLLKFYEPDEGMIRVGEVDFARFSHAAWRTTCGVVMQDGYIFSDTIERNISITRERADESLLNYAIHIANIRDLIDDLPNGLQTVIGSEGHGISQGQKQRILIARSVYKSPEYIFFDEATNALDATNESVILHNLETFFHGKTVVIVAHRLSTVKHADNIIVLEKGRIIEQGTHAQLTRLKGAYYTLVKNQLELDA